MRKLLFDNFGSCFYDDFTLTVFTTDSNEIPWKVENGLIYWQGTHLWYLEGAHIQQAYQKYLMRLITSEEASVS